MSTFIISAALIAVIALVIFILARDKKVEKACVEAAVQAAAHAVSTK